MKKYILLIISVLFITSVNAKKVKFSVDMTGQTLSPNGIHVSGDFQVAAGFPANWESNTTTLLQEGATEIYSTILDIPAFAKYEYKYVNGDQFYEAEFVPVESRVGYNFNDNRWIYVDSTANDTTDIGTLLFAANAPAGMVMIRFIVDMQNEIVSNDGVYVDGSFQPTPSPQYLYNFDAAVFEGIRFVSPGTIYQYRFYNGNNISSIETVPSGCEVNGNREILPNADIVLSTVCFSSCTACTVTALNENQKSNTISIYPNPASEYAVINFNAPAHTYAVSINDITGRLIRSYPSQNSSMMRIEKDDLNAGVYFVNVMSENSILTTQKLVIE